MWRFAARTLYLDLSSVLKHCLDCQSVLAAAVAVVVVGVVIAVVVGVVVAVIQFRQLHHGGLFITHVEALPSPLEVVLVIFNSSYMNFKQRASSLCFFGCLAAHFLTFKRSSFWNGRSCSTSNSNMVIELSQF
ncbi:unnamed protein product [Polarella glacialis]|uniref:Uncharacterized protein n=1 Tax=Polarella glacialis TaxID=89957 RepID=A0A813KFX4_POLGL|nr:unnamed protein product [Polarella glacialis]